jgi:hypothetical protein
MPRPRPRKLAIKLVLVLGLLSMGAIINMAVAWACVLRIDSALTNRQVLTPAEVDEILPAYGYKVAPGRLPILADRYQVLGFAFDEVVWMQRDSDGRLPAHQLNVFSAGWPFLALEGTRCDALMSDVWTLPSSVMRLDNYRGYPLPTRPLSPGFAINTILYAAMLWVVFATPGMIKRTRRRILRGRGLCIHCGYDLRGQPAPPDGNSIKCPECGRS